MDSLSSNGINPLWGLEKNFIFLYNSFIFAYKFHIIKMKFFVLLQPTQSTNRHNRTAPKPLNEFSYFF